MLIIFMVISFALIFIAGMHYAMWDNFGYRTNLYFCLGMSVLGLWNFVSAIGYAVKVN